MSDLSNAERFMPVKIDWPRCLAELRAAGWTPYKVALTICADAPTVYAWEKGKAKPMHAYGDALLNLHRHVCGDESSQKLYSDSRLRL